MKKRNLKALKLNKKSVSNLQSEEINGGTGISFLLCPVTQEHDLCKNSYDGNSIPNPCHSKYPCV